jgi:hypothetical protein
VVWDRPQRARHQGQQGHRLPRRGPCVHVSAAHDAPKLAVHLRVRQLLYVRVWLCRARAV